MSRSPLPESLVETPVVAIFRRTAMDDVVRTAEVLAETGISTFEVTLDGDDALATVSALASRGRSVGAGTVRSVDDATAARDSGADFLVLPVTAPDVVEWAVERGIPVFPAGFTPTEIDRAWALGATAVKLFPASTGGVAHLEAVRAPLPDIALVPTGGISSTDAAGYLLAGAVAVGVGSWLTAPTGPESVSARARSLVAAIRN